MIADKLYKQADLVVLFSKDRISLQVLANGFFSAEKIRKAIMHQMRKYENEDYTDFVYDLNKKIYCPLYLGGNHFLTFEITKDDEIYDVEKTNHDDCKAVIELKLSKFDYTITVLTYTENCFFEPVFKFYPPRLGVKKMSEIKEFLCVGCGEVFDEIRFINYFYIVLKDEKYEYQIRFDKEVFKCYSQMLKFPFPVKLDLQNYRILQQTNIHDANEQDLRNIMKAK